MKASLVFGMLGSGAAATAVAVPTTIHVLNSDRKDGQYYYLANFIKQTFEKLKNDPKTQEERQNRQNSYCGINSSKKGVCIPLFVFNTSTNKAEPYDYKNPQSYRKATLKEAYEWAKEILKES